MHVRTVLAALIVGAAVLSSSPQAHTATATFSSTFPLSPLGPGGIESAIGATPSTFPMFFPTLGTLNSITINVQSTELAFVGGLPTDHTFASSTIELLAGPFFLNLFQGTATVDLTGNGTFTVQAGGTTTDPSFLNSFTGSFSILPLLDIHNFSQNASIGPAVLPAQLSLDLTYNYTP